MIQMRKVDADSVLAIAVFLSSLKLGNEYDRTTRASVTSCTAVIATGGTCNFSVILGLGRKYLVVRNITPLNIEELAAPRASCFHTDMQSGLFNPLKNIFKKQTPGI